MATLNLYGGCVYLTTEELDAMDAGSQVKDSSDGEIFTKNMWGTWDRSFMEDDAWPSWEVADCHVLAEPAEKPVEAKEKLTDTEILDFIAALSARKSEALEVVYRYLHLTPPALKTFWSGILMGANEEDRRGFYHYDLSHGLGAEDVVVSVEWEGEQAITPLWTYRVYDENTVSISCPTALRGFRATVKIKES